jgi:hypothetical protein
MNRKDWQFIDTWSKKLKAVNHLGKECKLCGNNNIFHFTFHHRNKDEKEYTIGEIRSGRWSKIFNEIEKCDLVCKNCHEEIHYNENIQKESSTKNNKRIFLDIKGGQCEICGYDKCPSSLVFHHLEPTKKEFRMAEVKYIKDIEIIINELNKCQLLCQNCHQETHIDKDRYFKYEKNILEKSKSDKERQGKIDRYKVFELYNKGIKKSDIARILNASKGTISDIINKNL